MTRPERSLITVSGTVLRNACVNIASDSVTTTTTNTMRPVAAQRFAGVSL